MHITGRSHGDGKEIKRFPMSKHIINHYRGRGMLLSATFDNLRGEIVLLAVKVPKETLEALGDLEQKPDIQIVGANEKIET